MRFNVLNVDLRLEKIELFRSVFHVILTLFLKIKIVVISRNSRNKAKSNPFFAKDLSMFSGDMK